MNLRIDARQIAKMSLKAERFPIEHEKIVGQGTLHFSGTSHAKFERHVKSRQGPDDAQIVNGNAAIVDEGIDSHQPTLTSLRFLKCQPRRPTGRNEPRRQRHEHGLVVCIVRNVQKDLALSFRVLVLVRHTIREDIPNRTRIFAHGARLRA